MSLFLSLEQCSQYGNVQQRNLAASCFGRRVPFSKDSVMPYNLDEDPGSCSPSLTSIDKREGGEGATKTTDSAKSRCRVFDHSLLGDPSPPSTKKKDEGGRL